MRGHRWAIGAAAVGVAVAALAGTEVRDARATLPPGNTAQQWDKIAEDTIVGSGLFWRPVTAIDPASVSNDGFGPVPGVSDGNPATVEQAGWRPLITTPNHPEYPSAHCSVTAAAIAVVSSFLGTDAINVDIHGFDPAGPAGNLNAVRHFATSEDLREQVANARVWGGMHWRFSTVAGDDLGTQLAAYDLSHAFSGKGDK